ncbi:MAG: hypothetical protein UT13_C0001G0024 [Candidatus Pacebacteria bacterium GW2011_GWF2_38_9]|nr:MAG: hypothetical protein US01_C0001G0024 [candidate division TM6 bacterium GW2011_GWF2_28_16]KKQ08346.1 MAG: hypothetical protein US20_C0019G0003 [Candidatus Pacebacteria bacterium GW2011_GWF1_36_5]KKQ88378.1 MAG: hypothetical protein UT13_C0001G0024 [Candidatus Pacebacteria bacterium GW2011_GWF2_38_9]HAZ72995.1 hypothetical protein [Candidatus Paceibacterota bacterium]
MTEINRFAEKHENAKEALLAKLSEVLESYLDGKYSIDDVISVVKRVLDEKLSPEESRDVTDLFSFLIRAKNHDGEIPKEDQRRFFGMLGFVPVSGEVVDDEDTDDNEDSTEAPGNILDEVAGGNGGNGGGIDNPGGNPEQENNEVPGFVVKFFQLDVVRGNLWEKDQVADWQPYDYVKAIMSYVARDLKSEAHKEYPMQAIWQEAVTKKYVIEGEQQKFSLHEDILPAFPSREIRDEVEWFFNALNAIEKGAESIEDKRTQGDPDKFFSYLKEDVPQPFRWGHFFRSKIELNGQEEKFTTIGANLSFGELAQTAVRYLLRRVADPELSDPDHNMFAHNARRGEISKEMGKDFANLIQRISPELRAIDGGDQVEENRKKEKAEILAFLVVNYSVKFLATLVPWPISDLAILRYDSLIPTKLFRFGASERKYLTEEEQSGKLSVYDRVFIANFGRLLNNGLISHVLRAKYATKDEVGNIVVKEEFVTLLELLMHQCLTVEKDKNNLTHADGDIERKEENGWDERQRMLLDKFPQLNKVYLKPLPDLINENIPANIGGYWDGMIEHANDIWKLIKTDSLPMKNLLREVSSRGIFEDFKTKVPAEELKNNLANIYKRADYWMGDSVLRDKDGNRYEFDKSDVESENLADAQKMDEANRFMKIRVIKKRGDKEIGTFILMNFRESFVLSPDWNGDNDKLRKELEVSKEEVKFMQLDPERLYKEPGDQYTLLRKLITEKFVIASIRHYLQEETNKNYLSYQERAALVELLSSQFANELTEANPLKAAFSKRRPMFFGESYPVVSTGIWTKNEALKLVSIFPEEPILYGAKSAVKDKK